MKVKEDDPVIREVREVRRRISAACGHDPQRLVAYYIKFQEKYRNRLLQGSKAGSFKGISRE